MTQITWFIIIHELLGQKNAKMPLVMRALLWHVSSEEYLWSCLKPTHSLFSCLIGKLYPLSLGFVLSNTPRPQNPSPAPDQTSTSQLNIQLLVLNKNKIKIIQIEKLIQLDSQITNTHSWSTYVWFANILEFFWVISDIKRHWSLLKGTFRKAFIFIITYQIYIFV